MSELHYSIGSLVKLRGREWIVTDLEKDSSVISESSAASILTLRPVAKGEETTIHTSIEQPETATFAPPDIEKDIGNYASARLLSDAIRLKLKNGAGAFRSAGMLSFEPRDYQYVPLLMALQQITVRLLIADDVGIGKTIEAGMVVSEMLARRDIKQFSVLCPPHLCEQWQAELQEKFNISAQLITAALASRLESQIPPGENLFKHFPYTVVSLDFIKSDRRRNEFVHNCPEFIIVDEAHTRVWRGGSSHQGYHLLKQIAADAHRHLILLTATPHTGDDIGYFNLLSLLDSDFADLKTATGSQNTNLRRKLAQHFVQRQRQDIVNIEQQNNPFPQRQSKEIAYSSASHQAYSKLLQDTLQYCQHAIQQTENPMHHWSMLGLLRCLSSSPKQAEQSLQKLLHSTDTQNENIDENTIKRHIVDTDTDDNSGNDLSPPITINPSSNNTQLTDLFNSAKQIAAKGDDPKLKSLEQELKSWVKQQRQPIVFCRYIATANYLAEHLLKNPAFKKTQIEVVTGEIPPIERTQRVEAMAEKEQRILIATDCLSEGINLQDYFDSVIHYDLSWNPTRHQQREGRVDRYGQRSKTVHTCMIYGQENPLDGAVLQVILKKAENILRELGVFVPLPDDADNMIKALLQAVLLKHQNNQQLSLGLYSELDEAKYIEINLTKNAQKRKNRRSLFAQNTIDPEKLIQPINEVIEKLGGTETVERFIISVLRRRGIEVKEYTSHPRTYSIEYNSNDHSDLKPWLPENKNLISFAIPAAPKALYLHRAHPMVRFLSEKIFESALLPTPKYAYRAGAYFSNAIENLTTIVVLRMRHQLLTRRNDIHLAEETAILRVEGVNQPILQDDESVLNELDTEPTHNMDENRKKREVANAIQRIEGLQDEIYQLAQRRAEELREAHLRVRNEARLKSNLIAIERADSSFPDIIGVYVVLPFMG